MIRESVDEFGQYTLERKQAAPHADHSISNKVRGLPKAIKATIASPSRGGMSSTHLVAEVRRKHGALIKKQRQQVVAERKHVKQKVTSALSLLPASCAANHPLGPPALTHPLASTQASDATHCARGRCAEDTWARARTGRRS